MRLNCYYTSYCMIIDQIVFLPRQDICLPDRIRPRAATYDAALSQSRFVKNKEFSAEGKFPPDAKNVRQESKNGRYSQMALITSLTTLKAISPMNTPMATSAALFGSISSSMDLSFCWLVVENMMDSADLTADLLPRPYLQHRDNTTF